MGSTLDKLKNSLGFGNQINDLKNNQTPEVDSIGELHNLILSGDSRITQLEQNINLVNINEFSGNTITKLNNLESYSGTSNTKINNLENKKVAFSPMNISSCDLAPTAASTQYYYLTVSEMDMLISNAKIWGYSGSDLVMVGIYRGTLSSHTLIGEGSLTCGIGPNIINITAKSGQNLNVTAGENLVVGFYPDGTSWRTIYDTGISDTTFGITNTSNVISMPSTITGTATGIRFALTLY